MKQQYVCGNYNNNGTITLHTRDENLNRNILTIRDFKPYFYVPQTATVERTPRIDSVVLSNLTSLNGTKLQKVYTKTPGDVRQVRDSYIHYEADIPFVRRMMIDTGLKSGMDTDYKILSFNQIKPVDFTVPPRIIYCDIETRISDSTITIVCFYDSYSEKYFTVFLKEDIDKPVIKEGVVFVPTEKSLLETTSKFLSKIQPDVFTGWNINFDKEFLDERAEKHRISLPWETMNVFDLLRAYKVQTRKSFNRLVDVVESEELDIPEYQPYEQEFYDNPEKAIKVNRTHVESCILLDKKYNIINFYWDLKNFGGFESLDSTLFHGAIIENLLLRLYHNKYVLNSRPNRDEVHQRHQLHDKDMVGGKVFTPPVGIFDDVGVYDMTRYYPEIMISKKLSPDPDNILPEFVEKELVEKRLEYDALLKKQTPGSELYNDTHKRRQVVKDTIQSVVGYFGAPHSRVFDYEIFNAVTTTGQKGLNFIKDICEKDGHKFLYGDTDSTIIQISRDEAFDYVDRLNSALEDFVKEEGITRKLSLKLDRYYKRVIFKRKKGTNEGAKKRYAAHVTWENKEVDYIYIRGFEYVRRDSSTITKNMQKKLFDIILKGNREEVVTYIKSELDKVKTGKYSLDEIAIPVTISKNPKAYGGHRADGSTIGTPDYVRGCLYTNEWFNAGIKAGDFVKFLYIKKVYEYPQTDVISLITFKKPPVKFDVDMEKMQERTIRGKLEDIIELIGLTWNEIYPRYKSLF